MRWSVSFLFVLFFFHCTHTLFSFPMWAHSFIDAYSKGLQGKGAVWAAKKYCGHCVLPESILQEFDDAEMASKVWFYLFYVLNLILLVYWVHIIDTNTTVPYYLIPCWCWATPSTSLMILSRMWLCVTEASWHVMFNHSVWGLSYLIVMIGLYGFPVKYILSHWHNHQCWLPYSGVLEWLVCGTRSTIGKDWDVGQGWSRSKAKVDTTSFPTWTEHDNSSWHTWLHPIDVKGFSVPADVFLHFYLM